ncbi:hypothetical protein GCM10010211_45740 [Streptomyces albospinus]|uniref:Uncharacterized protein n=1 Tax=Streptomyces albospinus TaxID=285515 RepID=A0ABQ2VBE3_9ACTN|nr:hypothetical protein [Streptomyces albospinus]GGU74692.1 hypothetical protein GCM10010211_45740 [Streptomyces albospinus]
MSSVRGDVGSGAQPVRTSARRQRGRWAPGAVVDEADLEACFPAGLQTTGRLSDRVREQYAADAIEELRQTGVELTGEPVVLD